jgi:hypothetical protein
MIIWRPGRSLKVPANIWHATYGQYEGRTKQPALKMIEGKLIRCERTRRVPVVKRAAGVRL